MRRRNPLLALIVLTFLAPLVAFATERMIHIELNSTEGGEQRCRLTFLIANKAQQPIESLRLDLALFDPDGVVQRRMVAEFGPVRAAKTMVRTFAVEGDCGQIAAVLVNDVAGCNPGTPDTCLDALTLSSRLKGVRLYK
jgi:hypothetical protein